ncbi:MAG: hypothetical protein ABIG11_00730 [bacterium]
MENEYTHLEQLVNDVTSLDTARMTLRWALERLQTLEKTNADISRELKSSRDTGEKLDREMKALRDSTEGRSRTLEEQENFHRKMEATMELLSSGKLDVAQLLRQEAMLERRRAEMSEEYQKRFEELDRTQQETVRRWNQRLLDVEGQYAQRLREAQTRYDELRNKLGKEHQERMETLENGFTSREKELLERVGVLEESLKLTEKGVEERRAALEREFTSKKTESDNNYQKLKSMLGLNLDSRLRGLEDEHSKRMKSLEQTWEAERSRLLDEQHIRENQFRTAQEKIKELENLLAMQQARHHAELVERMKERETAFREKTTQLEEERAVQEEHVRRLSRQLSEKEQELDSAREKLGDDLRARRAELEQEVHKKVAFLEAEYSAKNRELSDEFSAGTETLKKDLGQRFGLREKAWESEKTRLEAGMVSVAKEFEAAQKELEAAQAGSRELEAELLRRDELHGRELLETKRTCDAELSSRIRDEVVSAVAPVSSELNEARGRIEDLKIVLRDKEAALERSHEKMAKTEAAWAESYRKLEYETVSRRTAELEEEYRLRKISLEKETLERQSRAEADLTRLRSDLYDALKTEMEGLQTEKARLESCLKTKETELAEGQAALASKEAALLAEVKAEKETRFASADAEQKAWRGKYEKLVRELENERLAVQTHAEEKELKLNEEMSSRLLEKESRLETEYSVLCTRAEAEQKSLKEKCERLTGELENERRAVQAHAEEKELKLNDEMSSRLLEKESRLEAEYSILCSRAEAEQKALKEKCERLAVELENERRAVQAHAEEKELKLNEEMSSRLLEKESRLEAEYSVLYTRAEAEQKALKEKCERLTGELENERRAVQAHAEEKELKLNEEMSARLLEKESRLEAEYSQLCSRTEAEHKKVIETLTRSHEASRETLDFEYTHKQNALTEEKIHLEGLYGQKEQELAARTKHLDSRESGLAVREEELRARYEQMFQDRVFEHEGALKILREGFEKERAQFRSEIAAREESVGNIGVEIDRLKTEAACAKAGFEEETEKLASALRAGAENEKETLIKEIQRRDSAMISLKDEMAALENHWSEKLRVLEQDTLTRKTAELEAAYESHRAELESRLKARHEQLDAELKRSRAEMLQSLETQQQSMAEERREFEIALNNKDEESSRHMRALEKLEAELSIKYEKMFRERVAEYEADLQARSDGFDKERKQLWAAVGAREESLRALSSELDDVRHRLLTQSSELKNEWEQRQAETELNHKSEIEDLLSELRKKDAEAEAAKEKIAGMELEWPGKLRAFEHDTLAKKSAEIEKEYLEHKESLIKELRNGEKTITGLKNEMAARENQWSEKLRALEHDTLAKKSAEIEKEYRERKAHLENELQSVRARAQDEVQAHKAALNEDFRARQQALDEEKARIEELYRQKEQELRRMDIVKTRNEKEACAAVMESAERELAEKHENRRQELERNNAAAQARAEEEAQKLKDELKNSRARTEAASARASEMGHKLLEEQKTHAAELLAAKTELEASRQSEREADTARREEAVSRLQARIFELESLLAAKTTDDNMAAAENLARWEAAYAEGSKALEDRRLQLEREWLERTERSEAEYRKLKTELAEKARARSRTGDDEIGARVRAAEQAWESEKTRFTEELARRDKQLEEARSRIVELGAMMAETTQESSRMLAGRMAGQETAYRKSMEEFQARQRELEQTYKSRFDRADELMARRRAELEEKEKAVDKEKAELLDGFERRRLELVNLEAALNARAKATEQSRESEKARLFEELDRRDKQLEDARSRIMELGERMTGTTQDSSRLLADRMAEQAAAYKKSMEDFQARQRELEERQMKRISELEQEYRLKLNQADEHLAGRRAALEEKENAVGKEKAGLLGGLERRRQELDNLETSLNARLVQMEEATRAREEQWLGKEEELRRREQEWISARRAAQTVHEEKQARIEKLRDELNRTILEYKNKAKPR